MAHAEPDVPGRRIHVTTAAPTERHARSIWDCYRTVFGDAPDYSIWVEETLRRHARRDGFRLVSATDGATVAGFAWGYIGSRGQYWTDLAAGALSPDVAATWLGGHFEFVELGVAPERRRHGLGQALHDALLQGVDRPCLLSTIDEPSDPAVRLYVRSGWRRLGVLTPGRQIMGRMPEWTAR
ncbi:GNAT family N-acetyltransferase [Microbacterium resistens]|uniref:GNAT family N-acetyltransferase n=1 Tax=Microbacterium resistens TaxID=156977 RepID=UPI0008319F67|nr:GNAT family N-acetyltransferase [Microbacterium resistens]